MPHISDDQLELYLMGRLNEQELAPLEEHLLICEECRDRLEKTEAYIAAMRAILRRQKGRKSDGPGVHHPHLKVKGLFLSLRNPRSAIIPPPRRARVEGSGVVPTVFTVPSISNDSEGMRPTLLYAVDGPSLTSQSTRSGAELKAEPNSSRYYVPAERDRLLTEKLAE